MLCRIGLKPRCVLPQRQHRETGQPVFTHVFPADMRQAGIDMHLGRPPRCIRIRGEFSQGTPAPGSTEVQSVEMRDFPSLRSLTEAGVNRVAGSD